MMTFHVTRENDGTIHVQNVLGGMLGQHHVHTPEGFDAWRTPGDEIVETQGASPCTCGLQPQEARSHLGNVTVLP